MRTGPRGYGPSNITAAIRVELGRVEPSRGVTVVMNGTIHAAIKVRELHSSAADAFYSREPRGHTDSDEGVR